MSVERFDEAAYSRTMRALAAPARFKILDLLRHGELSAGEIGSRIEQESSAVSFHLRTLLTAGIVRRKAQGRTHLYELVPAVFQPGDRRTRPDRIDLGYCRLEFP